MGLKATNLIRKVSEAPIEPNLALEDLVSSESIKIIVKTPEKAKYYTIPEYVSDALRFLLESGIITSKKSLPQGWEQQIYEGMGGGKMAVRTRKQMKGSGEEIRKELRCKEREVHGKMTSEVDIYLLRQLTATALRERLPHVYKSPSGKLSFPQISRIVGYTSHASSINANYTQKSTIRNAIDLMNDLLQSQ